MLVAIEGMDGVGKNAVIDGVKETHSFTDCSNVCRNVFDMTVDQEVKGVNYLYALGGNTLTSCYYLMGHAVTKQLSKETDIIVDRHFLSSYYHDYTGDNDYVFENFVKMGGVADLTIILYACPEARMQRIRNRDINDADLKNAKILQDRYHKLVEGAEKFDIPYVLINTDGLCLFDVIELCNEIISMYKEGKVDELKAIHEVCTHRNLRDSIHELKKILGKVPFVRKRQQVALNPEVCDTI